MVVLQRTYQILELVNIILKEDKLKVWDILIYQIMNKYQQKPLLEIFLLCKFNQEGELLLFFQIRGVFQQCLPE